MERLVEELYTFKGKVEDCENDYFISVQEKLREYEDAEKQGLLLRFPCKVGDTVYMIHHQKVYEAKVTNKCHVVKNILYISCEDSYWINNICCDDFGKTVFLTQEEAEQKLKEMEGNK